jgi:NAD(P)H-hydrate epimerase
MDRVTSLPSLPPRPADGHKGTFGRVLVVGGHHEMIGAPVLAGTAALRMGAGLVQIAVPLSILPAAISITPELIGMALDGAKADRRLLDVARQADAVVLGPGLGQSPEARRRVLSLVRLDLPMVVDADALNLLAAEKAWPKGFHAHAVLTPHPGEMARLAKLFGESRVPSDDEGRVAIATQAADAFHQTIVLKGHRTVVTDGQRLFINRTGNTALAKAGTGDVLSGMIATLLAQHLHPFDAACLAVHLHGRAGEAASQLLGPRSVLARDVINSIPTTLRSHPRSIAAGQR